jgi:hypothetical protein
VTSLYEEETMKKLFTLVALLGLGLGTIGCGGAKQPEPAASGEPATEMPGEPAEPSAEPAPSEAPAETPPADEAKP